MVMVFAVTPGVDGDAPALAATIPVDAMASAKADADASANARRLLFNEIIVFPPIVNA
jgi:hypothetical protein